MVSEDTSVPITVVVSEAVVTFSNAVVSRTTFLPGEVTVPEVVVVSGLVVVSGDVMISGDFVVISSVFVVSCCGSGWPV